MPSRVVAVAVNVLHLDSASRCGAPTINMRGGKRLEDEEDARRTPRFRQRFRGILLLLGSMLIVPFMDAAAKGLEANFDHPLLQVVWLRMIMQAAVTMPEEGLIEVYAQKGGNVAGLQIPAAAQDLSAAALGGTFLVCSPTHHGAGLLCVGGLVVCRHLVLLRLVGSLGLICFSGFS